MTFTSAVICDVYTVRWQEPVVSDVGTVVREVQAARKASAVPLGYIAIIPAESKAPDEAVRGAMKNSINELLQEVSALHFVIEGAGFKHAIIRSMLTSIAFVVSKRNTMVVHPTVDDALKLLFADELKRESFRKTAVQKGMLA